MFKQQLTINTNQIKDKISDLLKLNISQVTEIKATGYSSNVHKIKVYDTNDNVYQFILRGIYDSSELDFYKTVLEPFNLDSPKVYGLIDEDSNLYAVMEYIPHEPTDLEDEHKFRRAIDWLIKKDKILTENLRHISSFPCIKSHIWGPARYIDIIHRGAKAKVHPLLNDKCYDIIRSQFHGLEKILQEGTRTINHNDFQMWNILFGVDEKAGNMYIIDWAAPNIGSVCVDLALLILVAPNHIKSDLVERYRLQIDFMGFDEIFNAAQSYAKLFDLAWLVNVMLGELVDEVNEEWFKRSLSICCQSFRRYDTNLPHPP